LEADIVITASEVELEKRIFNRTRNRISLLMAVMGISLPLIFGFMVSVFFFLEGEISTLHDEVIKSNVVLAILLDRSESILVPISAQVPITVNATGLP